MKIPSPKTYVPFFAFLLVPIVTADKKTGIS